MPHLVSMLTQAEQQCNCATNWCMLRLAKTFIVDLPVMASNFSEVRCLLFFNIPEL